MNDPASLDRDLELKSKRLRLLETEAKIRSYELREKRQKRLLESWESADPWGYGAAGSSPYDGRQNFDYEMMSPISIAQDRRYGHFFPFWRSWVEHARHRAAARITYHLSPLVQGAIRGVGAYVIGNGIKTRAAPKHDDAPKDLLKAVQDWLDQWEKANDWHSLQIEMHWRYERDGEYFLRLFPMSGGRTLVRLVEPEFVVEPPGMPYDQASYGIITDPEDLWDKRQIYVSYDGSGVDGDMVPSTEIRQHKNNVDRQVKRGLSSISLDTLDLYRIAARLLENMGTGASIQAAIAFVRQHEIAPGAAVSDFVDGLADYDQTRSQSGRRETVQRFDAGTIIDMDAGQKFVPTDFAANVQNFTSAVQAILRANAVRWNAPEWITSADASNNSFASSMTAESPFVKRCQQTQGEFENVVQWAVDAAFRHHCTSPGEPAGDGFRSSERGIRAGGKWWRWKEIERHVALQVVSPTVETRDRNQEATLNKTYFDLGVKSPQTIAEEQNLDFEKEDRNIKQFKEEHPDPQQGGGAAGGVGGDPMAAMAGMMGGGGEGGDEAPRQEEPAAEESTGGDAGAEAAGGGDDLADAGLDDLLGSLGLPETDEEAQEQYEDEAEAAAPDPAVMKAVAELQKSVYGGEIPRAAAAALARVQGFDGEDAEALFPDAPIAGDEDDDEADEIVGMIESLLEGRRRDPFDVSLVEGGKPRQEGEEWESSGRWYRREGGKTVRFSKTKGESKPKSEPKVKWQSEKSVPARIKADVEAWLKGGEKDAARIAAHIGSLSMPQMRQLAKDFGFGAKDTRKALLAKKMADEAIAKAKGSASVNPAPGIGANDPKAAAIAATEKWAAARGVKIDDVKKVLNGVDARGGGKADFLAKFKGANPDDLKVLSAYHDAASKPKAAAQPTKSAGEKALVDAVSVLKQKPKIYSDDLEDALDAINKAGREDALESMGLSKDATDFQVMEMLAFRAKASDVEVETANRLKQKNPRHEMAKQLRDDHATRKLIEKAIQSTAAHLDSSDRHRAGLEQWRKDSREWASLSKDQQKSRLAEFQKKQSVYLQLKQTHEAHVQIAREKLLKDLGVEKPATISMKPMTVAMRIDSKHAFEPLDATTEESAAIDRGLKFLGRLTDAHDVVDAPFGRSATGRGFAKNGRVALGKFDPARPDDAAKVAVHEIGHVIEEKPGMRERVQAFVDYRLGDEVPVDMGDLPGHERQKGEMGRKDDFDRHFSGGQEFYVGRVYKGKKGENVASEIISMGVEALYTDPAGFIARDPEYAQFVISCMRAKKWRR